MAVTPNLNLYKPSGDDYVSNVRDLNNNYDLIDTAIGSNRTAIENDRIAMAVYESGDTATQAISAGQYVMWKGSLCIASSAIPSGATLSASNLTAVSNGGFNELNNTLQKLIETQTYSGGGVSAYRMGNVCMINVNGHAAMNAWSSKTLTTLPTAMRPKAAVCFAAAHDVSEVNLTITVGTNGNVNINTRDHYIYDSNYFNGGACFVCNGT